MCAPHTRGDGVNRFICSMFLGRVFRSISCTHLHSTVDLSICLLLTTAQLVFVVHLTQLALIVIELLINLLICLQLPTAD